MLRVLYRIFNGFRLQRFALGRDSGFDLVFEIVDHLTDGLFVFLRYIAQSLHQICNSTLFAEEADACVFKRVLRVDRTEFFGETEAQCFNLRFHIVRPFGSNSVI